MIDQPVLMMIDNNMLPRLVPGDNSAALLRAKKNIDDLPEVLLTEILCRLPSNKLIFQCKLVSKPWCNLISAPYFVGRYLCIQRQMQKPDLLTTLFHFDVEKSISLTTTSDHPVFKTTAGISKFTLNFLPCYSQAKDIEELAKGYPLLSSYRLQEPGSIVPPVVVGTYNDLVLCCATKYYQRHYYLCNPYTKQWVPLPPTPQVYRDAPVAFVCDSYFKYTNDHHNTGEEEQMTSTTITRTSSFILNAEYKWKVVRLVPNSSDPNFHFEIFSSETRQWREIYVPCSRPFSSFACHVDDFMPPITSSVAYKGMLYWWSNNDDGLVLELDLSKPNTVTYRFIEAPEDFRTLSACTLGLLGVSTGRLQLCIHFDFLNAKEHDIEGLQSFRIRELKQVVNGSQGKLKWLTDCVTIDCKDIEVPNPNTTEVLAFHPNNENVVYMSVYNKIFTCNLRGETLEKTAETRVKGHTRTFYYPFSLPWWPTPVPNSLRL